MVMCWYNTYQIDYLTKTDVDNFPVSSLDIAYAPNIVQTLSNIDLYGPFTGIQATAVKWEG